MSTERDQLVKEIFADALEKADQAERAAYLDNVCGADAQLRQQVEVLLQAHEKAGGFLEEPALGVPPSGGETGPANPGCAGGFAEARAGTPNGPGGTVVLSTPLIEGRWQDVEMCGSILECGGKRSATPLSNAYASNGKLRCRCALPVQSKTWWPRLVLGFIVLLSALCLCAQAQSYSIDWYTVDGGGGTSTGGVYSVSGTIGQHDAGGPMAGGNYSLTGGFWALISVVQTPGAPTLYISHSGNAVTVYWQDVSGWSLQQNANFALTTGWSAGAGVTNTNGTNYLNLVNPTGNLFFRLKH